MLNTLLQLKFTEEFTEFTRTRYPPGVCEASAHVDLGTCQPDTYGWATVNMDVAGKGTGDMSLTYGTKESFTDSDRKVHGPTVGTFSYQAANGRYFLPCKQTVGEKTIKVTGR